ncbi:hypothetical protein LWM68_36305 [Niabella sp. W65]|nr:hypothetical protein [Niabella sp. W65]MCH7367733.1 hypothetical protein [Niabella sp. W65]
MKVPNGHQPLMPYLILKNAASFIEFTKIVFGAKEVFKSYRDNDNKIIMHAEVQINGCNIMFADMNEFYGWPMPTYLFMWMMPIKPLILLLKTALLLLMS